MKKFGENKKHVYKSFKHSLPGTFSQIVRFDVNCHRNVSMCGVKTDYDLFIWKRAAVEDSHGWEILERT